MKMKSNFTLTGLVYRTYLASVKLSFCQYGRGDGPQIANRSIP